MMAAYQRQWIGLYTLAHKEISRFFRIWSQTLLPTVISIALYLFIFGNILGDQIGHVNGVAYIDYIVPGLILMSIINAAYINVASSFFSAKFQKNIEEILVSPLSSTMILWGYVLGGVTRSMTVGCIGLGIAGCFTRFSGHQVSVVVSVALLTALVFALAGLLNGLFAKRFDDVNFVPTFILGPLTYLGGVFYSPSVLPPIWQQISRINPIFYMMNAFRFGMIGVSEVSLWACFGILIPLLCGLYWICWKLLKIGYGIRT